MSDFLLELLSEEIPARMQAKAAADLGRLFAERIGEAGLKAEAVETFATPRRLALIARGLPEATAPVSEEIKGPRASAPPQALEGFLRKTGLAREALVERDGVLFAVIDRPGRAAAELLAEAIPALVRAFPWPKSMRWGAASASTESLRWVRPLHGIVALLGERIVDFEIAGIRSGAATVGHRFHHPGPITIGSATDYVEKLRACRVVLDPAERIALIRDGAQRLAAEAGLQLVEDESLLAENAGLAEWPVPLLGAFDPAFLDVPAEVIRLTMRTNQKYFALVPPRDGEGDRDAERRGGGGSSLGTAPPPPLGSASRSPSPSRGGLAPHFVCVANIEAADGGAAIAEGNRKVLAARLADARYFWEADLKVPLEQQTEKLGDIVFHEKLGTMADKVERVAKLARWLVEEGIVKSSPGRGGGPRAKRVVEGAQHLAQPPLHQPAAGPPPRPGEDQECLADLAERAARLAKADLVTGLVGEFPELQGVIGGHLACAQGEPAEVADAIRDHYKPAGQGDEVPTAPVTVAVSLADKLDTIGSFFSIEEEPTGSKDPFALRRTAIGVLSLVVENGLKFPLERIFIRCLGGDEALDRDPELGEAIFDLFDFFIERLKVQQKASGVRHDLIEAVFIAEENTHVVRLLARVKALQAFVATEEGADLLAGYKRAANILKKEGWPPSPSPSRGEGQAREASQGEGTDEERDALTLPSGSAGRAPPSPLQGEGRNALSYSPLSEESALIAALDAAEPAARAAVEREDFAGAMTALARLRAPVDAFFDKVTVNDPDPVKRAARLDLLLRMRDAVHQVADFSRIEG